MAFIESTFIKEIRNIRLPLFIKLFALLLCTTIGTYGTEKVNLQSSNLSISMTNCTLKDVLKELEKKSKYIFFYYDKNIDLKRKININVKNETTDNTYSIHERQIVISKRKVVAEQNKEQTVVPAKKMLKGKVVDNLESPLPGATITIEGSTRGVTTDIDGSFSIEVTPTDKIIVQFLGMESQTITVGNQNDITIKLKEKADLLDEVTVVAFAKQRKESVIASVSTIKPSDLKVPSSNLTTSFAGRIAGLISYQRTGEPGQDNADFFIRGVTTFGKSSRANPLI